MLSVLSSLQAICSQLARKIQQLHPAMLFVQTCVTGLKTVGLLHHLSLALLGHDPGCAAAPRCSFVLQTVEERAVLTALSSLNSI
eukprot:363711-Chlamydomonas_euryale.AAC.5